VEPRDNRRTLNVKEQDFSTPLKGAVLLVLACTVVNTGCRTRADAIADNNIAAGKISRNAGVLETAASMSSIRAVHTATPLPEGQVLIAGGYTGRNNAAAGAEIYDADAGTFAAAGAMGTPRYGHTATLLSDGKVLLAGGWDSRGEYLSSTEIYDPQSGAFEAAAAMTQPRAGHVAVPLDDGRVLLAGGVSTGWTFLASAELYDPATREFTSTGSMTVPRENHAAARMPDGRVLVSGGHTGRGRAVTIHDGAEIYDPASGTFSSTGSMGIRRHKHDAVLLPDGRVLVTGGSDERDANGLYSSAELYDPATAVFTATGAMNVPRYKHERSSVVLQNGLVLVAGGAARAEVYDPRTGTFSVVGGTARMPGQYPAIAVLSDGRVLITGGYGSDIRPRSEAWLYRP
jgi:hypothetical protein